MKQITRINNRCLCEGLINLRGRQYLHVPLKGCVIKILRKGKVCCWASNKATRSEENANVLQRYDDVNFRVNE